MVKRQGIWAVGVLGLSFAAVAFLVLTKPVAEKIEPAKILERVKVLKLDPMNHQTTLHAQGSVQAAKLTALSPQVSGRLAWKSERLIPGGRFKKGEIIARLDERDFAYGLEQHKANVERAQLQLEIEKAQQEVAEKDFERYLSDLVKTDQAKRLAIRMPHLEEKEASLRAAVGAMKISQLNLGRTKIRAPYNSIVSEVHGEIGSHTGPTGPLATLMGSDEFWVKIHIPVSDLPFITLPKGDQPGAKASVHQNTPGGFVLKRPGVVKQLFGNLSQVGHMAQLIVSIDNPLHTDPKNLEQSIPIFPGAQVEVEIEGKVLNDVYRIPRHTLIGHNTVWTLDQESRLVKRSFNVLFKNSQFLYVQNHFKPGERLVISNIRAPLPGMQVEVK